MVPNPTFNYNYISDDIPADVLRIQENSIVGFGQLNAQTNTVDLTTQIHLDLREGKIAGCVTKAAPASDYQVTFPTGRITVLSGSYLLASSGTLEILVGSTHIYTATPDGLTTTNTIYAGDQFDPNTGRTTALPKRTYSPNYDVYPAPDPLPLPSHPPLRPGI
ncbi:MAG: hypothetical protein JWQ71_4073 [Pedosphaera sp.]|nr:hypothetical protein [Pedosphaera sp.]